jgi:hypothetical protein
MQLLIETSISRSEYGYLTDALPVNPKPFPMILLDKLRTTYKSNIADLDRQIRTNYQDPDWVADLKETKSNVVDRLETVSSIIALYTAKTSAGKEKGLNVLREEREQAIKMYNTFVKEYPKG